MDLGVDESGAPPREREFRPDVQGLRAVAVALVVLYHARLPLLGGGYVGVDAFFVISGFVITGVLLRRNEAAGRPSLVDFYARRARRIIPMATLVILAAVAASYLWLGEFVGRSVAADGRAAAAFLANVQAIHVGTDYFHAGGPISPLLNYWSLSVEEQFYLVFPALVVLGLALGRRRATLRPLALLIGLATLASLLLSFAQTSSSPTVAYFSSLTRAFELGVGALCVLASPWAERWPRPLAAAASWIGLAAILAAALAFEPTTPFPGVAALLPVGGAALVLLAGARRLDRGAEALLSRRSLQVGGDLSYSIYLWHFPLLVIAAEAATAPLPAWQRAGLVGLTVLLAAASKRLVEDPVRHARRLMASRRASLGVGAVLVAGTVLVTSLLVATTGSPSTAPPPSSGRSPSLPLLERQVAAGVGLAAVPEGVVPALGPPTESLAGASVPSRCVVEEASQTSIDPCRFGGRLPRGRVLLLGDSTAAMWSSAFISIARQQQLELVLLAKTGCAPWLNRDLIFGGGQNPYCDRWHAFEVAEARRLKPDAIVVTGYVGEPADRSDVAGGVTGLLTALKAVTPAVTLLSNLPAVPKGDPDPATCVLVHPDDLTSCSMSMAAFEQSYGWFRRALEDGAASTQSAFVDLDPLFCTTTTCPMVVARHLVWRDLFHANVPYVGYVERSLSTLLERASWLSGPRA